MYEQVDVVVVGGGNAGFCAAHAAAERGRRRAAPGEGEPAAGGREQLLHGRGRPDRARRARPTSLAASSPTTAHAAPVGARPTPPTTFAADMAAVTEGRNDPALTEVLIAESRDALAWLHGSACATG